MIYILFKPLKYAQESFAEVPLFELNTFSLHELDNNGLVTVIKGDKAVRYKDFYTIDSIDFTDNSKKYRANMSAKNGFYSDNVIELYGDVTYKREDGLTFSTQEASYNKKTNIAQTDKKFIMYRGKDSITGTSLRYNNLTNKLSLKNIVAVYQLEER